jgi:hypothetical protein
MLGRPGRCSRQAWRPNTCTGFYAESGHDSAEGPATAPRPAPKRGPNPGLAPLLDSDTNTGKSGHDRVKILSPAAAHV